MKRCDSHRCAHTARKRLCRVRHRHLIGILAPANTPADVVAKLNAEMDKVIHSPDFKKRMQDIGAETIGNTQAQMAEQIASDTARFAKLVVDNKISTD